MSASARAEARRKAILSRGTDRLARLTTSARGDDPAYMHPETSTIRKTSSNFLGEETTMLTPPNPPSPPPHRQTESEPVNFTGTVPDPSVWSEQQQQQLLQALMAGTRPPESTPGLTPTSSLPSMDNPLAAMLFPQGQGAFSQFPPPGAEDKTHTAAAPTPPTRLQRLMPFVHLVSMWALLAYFVIYLEPRVWAGSVGGLVDVGARRVGVWRRWAELGRVGGMEDVALVLRIQVLDTAQPPTLLTFVLPHLPPPLPSVIVNAFKYLQMGSLFLDDLAGLLVGIGFIIMFSGWFATS
ncbi:hypothetical protein C0995_005548 [Termitomyces sp. Mi166|nr:hypothetical protein C0995_005548 [Termitomyces sp. Mi166\